MIKINNLNDSTSMLQDLTDKEVSSITGGSSISPNLSFSFMQAVADMQAAAMQAQSVAAIIQAAAEKAKAVASSLKGLAR
jgi:hypothetical protein